MSKRLKHFLGFFYFGSERAKEQLFEMRTDDE